MNVREQKLIEDNIHLIEAGKWEEFFKVAYDNVVPGIGKILYDAEIDFLSYLDEVPERCFAHTNLDSIIIPKNIVKISSEAFSGCYYLTSVFIPSSVKEIDSFAFSNCIGITDLSFEGTIEEWENVIFGRQAFGCVRRRTIKCADGDATLKLYPRS